MTEQELNAVRELNKKIRALERRLRSLRTASENIVPVLNGLPCSKGAKSRVEKIALDIVATERELESLHRQMPLLKSDLANRIMAEIDEPIRQTLLILRYIECLSFRETARRMRITLRHAFRVHENFLKCHIAEQKEG